MPAETRPGQPGMSGNTSSSWLQRSWKKQTSVMLWTGEQEAHEGTPPKGRSAAVEKIELGEHGGAATPKWSRPTSREAREAPVRLLAREAAVLPEHLGERVRRSARRAADGAGRGSRKHDINVRREKARPRATPRRRAARVPNGGGCGRAEPAVAGAEAAAGGARKLREQQTEEGEPRTKGRERAKKKKARRRASLERAGRGWLESARQATDGGCGGVVSNRRAKIH